MAQDFHLKVPPWLHAEDLPELVEGESLPSVPQYGIKYYFIIVFQLFY